MLGSNIFSKENYYAEAVTADQVARQVQSTNPELVSTKGADAVKSTAHRVMASPDSANKSVGELASTVAAALQASSQEETVKFGIGGKKRKTLAECAALEAMATQKDPEMLQEERTLNDNAASLIERATGICMEIWYNLTHSFHSKADKYDPEPVNPSEKFQFFKLAPGGDARQEAYKKIVDATENLADKLNDSLGRGGLFVPEIVMKNGHLETRVKYTEGNGGIFHCKSKDQDVGIGITLTMPRQGVIRDAFKSLVTTPNFPIGDNDELPEPERVIPDKPVHPDDDKQVTPDQLPDQQPDQEGGKQEPTLRDLGGVNIAGPGDFKDIDRAPLNQSYEPEGEELTEGKKPAEGFDAPDQRGFYVVYGQQKFRGDAEFYFKGAFKKFGVELPGKAFGDKESAVKAKNAILQSLRQNGKKLSAAGAFHVKYWDGKAYNAVNIPQVAGYQNIGTPEEEQPQEDEAPLSSGDQEEAPQETQQTQEPDQQQQPAQQGHKFCPHCGGQLREGIEHQCTHEEVAANATGGAWTSKGGAETGTDVTKDAKGKKKKKKNLFRRKPKLPVKSESGWSMSGGLFS